MLTCLRSWFCTHRQAVFAVCGIVCAYLLMYAVGITCPIKFITGISCPGCGLTRAWLSALRFDFAGAFAYHPLFWLVPIALALLALEKRFRACRIAFDAIVLLAVAVWILRIHDTADTVVVFAPMHGAVIRFLQAVRSLLGL